MNLAPAVVHSICTVFVFPIPSLWETSMSEHSLLRFATASVFRVGFWQNGFFADIYFWAAGFSRGFCRRIFSPHFCGKKCPEKSSRKIPGKILQNLYNKNPRHISAEGPGQVFCYRHTESTSPAELTLCSNCSTRGSLRRSCDKHLFGDKETNKH